VSGATRVVVVGSGAAGLAAAVAALEEGARVTLVERSRVAGGTTALSGGVAWLPANHRAAELGIDDSPGEARDYLASLALGDVDRELIDVFVDDAARVARALERTGLRWHPLPYPDYHAERPGGKLGGRSLEPGPHEPDPAIAPLLREAPNVRDPVTYAELAGGSVDRARVAERRARGVVTLGRALVAALLGAVARAGGDIRTGVRARRLVVERGEVTGVETDEGAIGGRVVLAGGGFERDPALVRAFLRGPMTAPAGVSEDDGDCLRMAMVAGAALGNMSEAWWCPALRVPGEEVDGAPLFRLVLTERARPGSLMVDGAGRRFVDEAANYNDVGRSLHDFDAARFAFPRTPAWLVFDAEYRARYALGPLGRGDPDPDWLARADDLAGLAAAIGVPADALAATVARFNDLARAGADEDFGRGSYAYDRFVGDQRAPDPTLRPLGGGPYYAAPVLPGCLGTKGGPRTDGRGRVLAAAGGPIPGLYAAGNAAASPFGLAYPGAGGTIGPALVFGYRAGEAAAAPGGRRARELQGALA
jgi:succinate dehydrogenase/fumarate reductase flavoprotein subunit